MKKMKEKGDGRAPEMGPVAHHRQGQRRLLKKEKRKNNNNKNDEKWDGVEECVGERSNREEAKKKWRKINGVHWCLCPVGG